MRQEEKHNALRHLLRPEAIWRETPTSYHCLPPELREQFDIISTDCVSAHPYDPFAQELIEAFRTGWVLDCGAGFRAEPCDNVVNYEIVSYPSTDVLGVAEAMPFRTGVFDAVICLNVLEHVKDPFRAAREIARVLKPGGKLYCVVPFLQPLHGYPHHYYNMTAQGLRNLFADSMAIDRQSMLASGLPVWTLNGILNTWRAGLAGRALAAFEAATVAELSANPVTLLDRSFVTGLSDQKNFELASTTALFGTKLNAEEQLARRGRGIDPEDALHVAELNNERLEGEVIAVRRRLAEATALLAQREAQVAHLDGRLNKIRRSRWWRFRRRLIHAFGYEDGVD
jgi:SAM-dependent methyltransferase